MKMNRSRFCITAIMALASLAGGTPGWAQGTFPAKPITLVVPFPAGGATDVAARMVAEKLQSLVGQNVVVENRSGGNTLIATNHVMAQRPDGYTLYLTVSTAIEQPSIRPATAKFDATSDLSPISSVGRMNFVLVVNSAFPARNVSEFIRAAKSRPNGVSMGIIGYGAADHLAGELLNLRAGTKLMPIPYAGSAPALVGVAAGDVDATLTAYGSARSFIDSGKVRVIASASSTRAADAALETIAETVPGVDVPVWLAVFGPKGMPPAVVQYLNTQLAAVMQMPDVQAKLRSLYIEPSSSSPEDLRVMVRARVTAVEQIMKERNLKIE